MHVGAGLTPAHIFKGGIKLGKGKIKDAVKSGRILVSDGAWGTFLQQKGLQPGECPELRCLTHPGDVLDIARSYIKAGADLIETNSFGGTVLKLEHYGLADKTQEINEAAARLSKEAAGSEVWVIASVGPTGKILIMGDVEEDDIYQAFKDQVTALAKGGADAICIETMSAIDEATLAIRAARENTGCEIICTFTFERTVKGEYRTMMGVTPTDAAKASIAAGADIIGANCGNGMKQMVEIVKEMRAIAPEVPILIHANAGLPQAVDGAVVYPETPAEMAALVPALVEAGANIIGGCCGTTPEHIKAMKDAVKKLKS
jgi:5-methyltetrahydrofolate--homocysteine methyltransferase